MAKALLNSVLILLILLNGMGYTFIQANFYLDREQITALYCVNKDTPKLECNGKCELGKRLSEAKNHADEQTEVSLEELRLVFIEQVILDPMAYHPIEYLNISYTTFYSWILTKGSELDFFHPPQG